MSEITRYPRYRVIAELEQDLHGMMTRPDGFMYEEAEVAIVRAAAEITGLTAGVADGVAGYLEGQEPDATPLALFTCTNFLRRYAELAK